jgi:methionyl-tRNA formyltransferase
MKNKLRILFYGTPEFSVESLKALIEAGFIIAGVVTAPDRLAGRGLKIHFSAVKEFAISRDLPLLQPLNLKDPEFVDQIVKLKPDLQVVIAFRMMPKVVWSISPLGTFNLHASLLPQYRGSAPINWAVINGEKETGITTFFIEEKIDTGNIIFRETVAIQPEETAGELHDRLMVAGAALVVKTARAIEEGTLTTVSQQTGGMDIQHLKMAPKIHKEDCRINWDNDPTTVFNFIRGLSSHPGAFTEIMSSDGTLFYLKVFRAGMEITPHHFQPGLVICDGKTYIKVAVRNGFIFLENLQPANRKPMNSLDFLKGYGSHFV